MGERITLRAVQPGNGRLMTVKAKIVAADPGSELGVGSARPHERRAQLGDDPLDGGTRRQGDSKTLWSPKTGAAA